MEDILEIKKTSALEISSNYNDYKDEQNDYISFSRCDFMDFESLNYFSYRKIRAVAKNEGNYVLSYVECTEIPVTESDIKCFARINDEWIKCDYKGKNSQENLLNERPNVENGKYDTHIFHFNTSTDLGRGEFFLLEFLICINNFTNQETTDYTSVTLTRMTNRPRELNFYCFPYFKNGSKHFECHPNDKPHRDDVHRSSSKNSKMMINTVTSFLSDFRSENPGDKDKVDFILKRLTNTFSDVNGIKYFVHKPKHNSYTIKFI